MSNDVAAVFNNGKFVISLDFELMWGVMDSRTMEHYGDNIIGVHKVIPRTLSLFDDYRIKGTFSTVGFLFFETKKELLAALPDLKPNYTKKSLSPYAGYMDKVGENYIEDQYHFAPQLIKLIQEFPEQEIGTHTFSHFFCREEGQTVADFKADIIAAKATAAKYDLELTSLIFPRNQFNDDYLRVIAEEGILCYRGNEQTVLYKARRREEETLKNRALRLADAYINVSGHNCYTDEFLKSKFPIDIPSTRFLRPFSRKTKMLEGLRLARITSGMTYAAKNNLTYHLWWHPHNFGIHQEENFAFLEKILIHYSSLNKKYNFESITMSALAKRMING